MAIMLLQLSLCVVTVIQLTSSQSTCDPYANEDDVNRCEDSDQVLAQMARVNSQLVAALSKIEEENAQILSANSILQTYVSQLMMNVSLLHKDIDQLKAASQRLNAKDCPPDFTYNASVNGCYKVVTRNMEWAMAGLECRSLHQDAHLLVVDNAIEQSAVAEMLDSINETALGGCARDAVQGVYFWTAGQRIDPSRESPFIWRVTSTSPCGETLSTMTYTNWHSGQPDYFQQHEACVNLASDHFHAWNDFPCHLGTCFICEIDM